MRTVRSGCFVCHAGSTARAFLATPECQMIMAARVWQDNMMLWVMLRKLVSLGLASCLVVFRVRSLFAVSLSLAHPALLRRSTSRSPRGSAPWSRNVAWTSSSSAAMGRLSRWHPFHGRAVVGGTGRCSAGVSSLCHVEEDHRLSSGTVGLRVCWTLEAL